MAQKIQTLFIDDIDGGAAEGTVRFALDGTEYEIDLNAKHSEELRSAIAKYALQPDATWMVGNSPKSDINPALAAGLHAVFVPHGNTWILEHEDLAIAPERQKLLVVERFADLRAHF